MLLSTRVLAASVFLLSVGCGSIKVVSNTLKIPADAKITLSEVKFDYAKWSSQDPKFLAKMKEKDPKLYKLLTDFWDDDGWSPYDTK